MKSLTKIILLVLTIMTLSCNSDNSNVSSSTKFSFIKAKINGSAWTTIQSNGTSFAGATYGALGNPMARTFSPNRADVPIARTCSPCTKTLVNTRLLECSSHHR